MGVLGLALPHADCPAPFAPPSGIIMSFLLFGVTALHILILVLLFVATLDKVRHSPPTQGRGVGWGGIQACRECAVMWITVR